MGISSQLRCLANQIIGSKEKYYHGTSSKLAEKILSQGFVSDPKKKVWDDLSDPRASYGGIYFSVNMGTAISAAGNAVEKFGGDRVIFEVQLETRTGLIDEDELLNLSSFIDDSFGYQVLSSETKSQDILGRDKFKKEQEKAVDLWLKSFKKRRAEQGKELDQRVYRNLIGPLSKWFIALLKNAAAGNVRVSDPEISELRSAKNDVMNALGSIAKLDISDSFSSVRNIRILDAVGFSGANKILSAVTLTNYHKEGGTKAKVLFGKPSPSFQSKLQSTISSDLVIE